MSEQVKARPATQFAAQVAEVTVDREMGVQITLKTSFRMLTDQGIQHLITALRNADAVNLQISPPQKPPAWARKLHPEGRVYLDEEEQEK